MPQRIAARSFSKGRGTYCGALRLCCIGIDENGNLYKCWEDVDKIEHIFGRASKWDPTDPIATADNPDRLTRYFKKNMQGFSVIQLPRGIAPFLSTNENKCLQNTCLA